MNKQEVYEYLKQRNIEYEAVEHKAVFNMDELNDIVLPYPELEAKNLFVRDDKKRNYYLITVMGDTRVDLKEFRKKYNTRALSFANNDDLYKYLQLIPGSVTPLGLLNNKECNVHFYLDNSFMNSLIGIHPNENTATIYLKTSDLIRLITEHGNEVTIMK